MEKIAAGEDSSKCSATSCRDMLVANASQCTQCKYANASNDACHTQTHVLHRFTRLVPSEDCGKRD